MNAVVAEGQIEDARTNQLDDDAICDLVSKLLQRAHAAGDVAITDAIVLVGGAALCLNGIRDSSGDIDLFGPEKLRRHARQLEAELRHAYGPHFAIDVTSEPTIWGRIRVPDIRSSAEMRYLDVGGRHYALRALDPETLFVVKSEAGREKDIQDLSLIAPHTSAEDIVVRWSEIMEANPAAPRFDSGANLLAEIAAQYLTEIKPEWIEALRLEPSEEADLKDAFLSRHLLRSVPSHSRGARP